MLPGDPRLNLGGDSSKASLPGGSTSIHFLASLSASQTDQNAPSNTSHTRSINRKEAASDFVAADINDDRDPTPLAAAAASTVAGPLSRRESRISETPHPNSLAYDNPNHSERNSSGISKEPLKRGKSAFLDQAEKVQDHLGGSSSKCHKDRFPKAVSHDPRDDQTHTEGIRQAVEDEFTQALGNLLRKYEGKRALDTASESHKQLEAVFQERVRKCKETDSTNKPSLVQIDHSQNEIASLAPVESSNNGIKCKFCDKVKKSASKLK